MSDDFILIMALASSLLLGIAIGIVFGERLGRVDVASGEWECVEVFDRWECGRL